MIIATTREVPIGKVEWGQFESYPDRPRVPYVALRAVTRQAWEQACQRDGRGSPSNIAEWTFFYDVSVD